MKATDLLIIEKKILRLLNHSQREYMRQQRDIEVLCTLHRKKAIMY